MWCGQDKFSGGVMDNNHRAKVLPPLFLLVTILVSVPAFSQVPVVAVPSGGATESAERNAGVGSTQGRLVVEATGGVEAVATSSTDFAGEWVVLNFEDRIERGGVGAGPEIGDYLGIPFNAAGRMRAETSDPNEWSTQEFQCRPHPMPYQWRAQDSARISKEIDPVNRSLKAYHVAFLRSLDRPIYMDGRPHPPEYAPHTWSGFSTAEFDGNTLVVTTTHLKESYFRRNGPTMSDQAKFTEWFIRHGDYFTVTYYLEDPIYLEEPFIQSVSYKWEPHTELKYYPCTVIDENISENIPHFLPEKNPFIKEFANDQGIPYEATRGGAETLYPEYRDKIKKMKAPN
jgi:hypothetical protein